jgi:hypothetical protein
MFTTHANWIRRAASAATLGITLTRAAMSLAQDVADQKASEPQKPAVVTNDNVWVDFGFPVQQRSDGQRSQPIFEFVDLDLDGRLDLYVANAVTRNGLYAAAPADLSEHWIGVEGSSADEALRAQLQLPEGQGVVLSQVIADSPAAKAGLRIHDVLLSVDGKPLGQLNDLADVIKENKGKLLTIKLVRTAKRISIEVTPEKRPPTQTGETCPGISTLDDAEFIRRAHLDIVGTVPPAELVDEFKADQRPEKRTHLVNRLLRETKIATKSCTACHSGPDSASRRLLTEYLVAPHAGLRTWIEKDRLQPHDYRVAINPRSDHAWWLHSLNITQPGVVVAPEPPAELPDDMTVTITRQGKQPVQIQVKQGDQSWETTGDKLDTLPANVRTHVERMLGVHRVAFDGTGRRQWVLRKGDNTPILRQSPLVSHGFRTEAPPSDPAAAAERLERQLQKLKAEFEEVQKSLGDLRKSLPVTTPNPQGGEQK